MSGFLSKMFRSIKQWYTSNKNCSRPNQKSSVLKLDIDCWESIFDYTSLADLHSISKTCKRMQAIAGFYYRTHHTNEPAELCDQNIFIDELEMNGFRDSISRLFISRVTFNNFCFNASNNFKSLKNIFLSKILISSTSSQEMKKLLNQIESITLFNCYLTNDGDLYENFLKFCTNLRTLKIIAWENVDFVIGTSLDTNWLLRTYPTLQHIYLDLDYSTFTTNKLKNFLQNNPNLKKLTITEVTFKKYLPLLMECDCQLEMLTIENIIGYIPLDDLVNRLNELHKRGFYQRLSLPFCAVVEDLADYAAIRALDSIFVYWIVSGEKITLSRPIQLKIVAVNVDNLVDFKLFIRNLENVEKMILFGVGVNFERLLFILQHLPTLREIKYLNGWSSQIIDLRRFNEERRKVKGARNVVIFVGEDSYLANKWNFGNEDFCAVTLQRFDYSED